MRIGLALLPLGLVACAAAPIAPDAATLDAAVGDAAIVDADTSVHDASNRDADWPRLDPTRPPGSPTLDPACGVRSYDVDEARTLDSAEELAVALFEAGCARHVRCHDTWRTCDPRHGPRPTTLHVPVDLALARACLASLDTSACATRTEDPSCRALLRGVAPDGAPCADRNGCASGRCVAGDAACGGTCQPLATCGACTSDEWCDPYTGTCRARLAANAYCSGSSGAPCAVGTECDAVHSRCLRQPGVGERCSAWEAFPGLFDYYCASGLLCDPTTLTCAMPVDVAVGDACSRLALCPVDAECREGVCVAFPRANEACPDHRCARGLRCNDAHVCAPVVGAGCACDERLACPYGLRCVGGSCEPIGLSATACVDDQDCPGYGCYAGFCFVRGLGALCGDDTPCSEGHCPGWEGRCVPNLPRGADCHADARGCDPPEECIGGRCAVRHPNPCRD